MSLFQRKTFWNISSSKRFLLNHFLLFTDLISFHCFFHLSPALDPWFAFLSGSVYSCLSSSLSVSPFFFVSQGSHRLTAEIFPERLKKRQSAPSWHTSICCVCVMISGLIFGFTEQAMETFWPSVQAFLLRPACWKFCGVSMREVWGNGWLDLVLSGFVVLSEWSMCGRWFGQWCWVFVYRISDTIKQMYSTSVQHLLCTERVCVLNIL